MIEQICNKLTNRIKEKLPDIDEERAEVINYGLQLLIGEIPKFFILFLVAYLLKVFRLTMLAFLVIIPYRACSGGVHLNTHIGCIVSTNIFYCGNALLSKFIVFNNLYIKYILIGAIWIFSIIMIKLYAPADTESVPILRKKERKIKKILSYITMTLNLLFALFIKNGIISNLLIFGTLMQTILITKFIYDITKNKFGYLEYIKKCPKNESAT